MSEMPQRGLALQIVEVLRERLLTGQLAPGTRINEVAIARELGISRGPLREAIGQLVSEGILVHRPNRGAVVFEATPDEVEALFELRTALETAVVKLAAARRDEHDVAALRKVCVETRRTLAGGRELAHRTTLDFHRTLFDVARSPRITDQVWRVQQQIIVIRSRQDVAASHTDASQTDHEQIAQAVAEGRGELAAQLMERHLDRVRLQVLTSMAGGEPACDVVPMKRPGRPLPNDV